MSAFNFDADKIKKAVANDWKYVEENLVELKFWLPRYKILSYFSKIQLLFLSFSQEFKLLFLKRKYSDTYNLIEILINEFDTCKTHSIINARCVIPIDNKTDLRTYIKKNYKHLISLAKKDALSRTNIFSSKLHRPITFIRLYIYPKSLRKRQILFRPVSSGLFSTIEWDQEGSIPASEIFDNTTFEVYGQYRITWDEDQ